MKIVDVQAFQFSLPCRDNLRVKQTLIRNRDGFLLKVTSDDGYVGYGEISPLPGFSRELSVNVPDILKDVKTRLLNHVVPSHIERMEGKISHFLEDELFSPAVRCGIDMALLFLAAHAQHMSLSRLINHGHSKHIPVTCLLQGDRESILREAREKLRAGIHVFKLKVGGDDLQDDIDKFNGLCEVIKDKGWVRLDANQQWDLDSAVKFAQAVDFVSIEYIEDPLKDVGAIPEFFHRTMIPVALDEAVQKLDFKLLKSIEGVDVLVVKPTVFGGLEKTWRLAHQAKALGMRTIISSSFESGLGIVALAHFSSCLSHNVPMGLDTLKWFAKDILLDPPPVENGMFVIGDELFDTKQIDDSMLHEIPL